jgi:hypothetical protein
VISAGVAYVFYHWVERAAQERGMIDRTTEH